MRADGSHLANLTQNVAFDAAPDWQPLDDHHGEDDHHGDDDRGDDHGGDDDDDHGGRH